MESIYVFKSSLKGNKDDLRTIYRYVSKRIKRFIFKIVRFIGRAVYTRHVWLVSDRESCGGDNGEAFFRYLQNKDVNAVFAISDKCDDHNIIKKIGATVPYGSLKYKLMLCVADCHCSSQLIHMENHSETPQIFLQHGVAVNDISDMLKPALHDNFYIVTSLKREQDLILQKNDIPASHVWLTGLPRYDRLKSDSLHTSKKVVLAFTWRPTLKNLSLQEVEDSEYFKIIKKIMSDDKLGEMLKEYGYEMYIKLHPEMEDFKELVPNTDICRSYELSYRQMFDEASLMITDYSSCVFDFIYLDKPIIYYHFDNSLFNNNPFLNSEGAFDYEEYGFGPVINDYDSFIDQIRKYLINDCAVESKYKERYKNCFAYKDGKSCERIYNNIKKVIENERQTSKTTRNLNE